MVKEKYDLCFGIPLVGGFLIVFIDIVNHNGGGSPLVRAGTVLLKFLQG